MNFKKKLGPLPVWAWGLIGGVLLYLLYERQKNASSTSTTGTSPTASVFDPNAIDPNTGLTYGQEYGMASPSVGGLGGSGNGSATGAPDITGELGNLSAIADLMQQLGFLAAPTQPSTTTTTALNSPPIKHKAHRVAHKPRVNKKHPKMHHTAKPRKPPKPAAGHRHEPSPAPTPAHHRGRPTVRPTHHGAPPKEHHAHPRGRPHRGP